MSNTLLKAKALLVEMRSRVKYKRTTQTATVKMSREFLELFLSVLDEVEKELSGV